jgi:hypothetical protein
MDKSKINTALNRLLDEQGKRIVIWKPVAGQIKQGLARSLGPLGDPLAEVSAVTQNQPRRVE